MYDEVFMDSRFEKVSALMDGELGDVRKESERMESDPELLERWDRYSLIADLMKGEDVAVPQTDLAADFDRALSEEAVYMSPSSFHKGGAAAGAKKSAAAANEESFWVRGLRKVAGFAIAASVAAVTIVGVQQYSGITPNGTISTAPMGGVAPVSAEFNGTRIRNAGSADASSWSEIEHAASRGVRGQKSVSSDASARAEAAEDINEFGIMVKDHEGFRRVSGLDL